MRTKNNRNRRCRRSLLFVILLIIALSSSAASAEICGYPSRGTLKVFRGNDLSTSFRIALATTPDEHRQGLMHCRELAGGSGLLFIYSEGGRHVFWMKNTPLELAIIFISATGRIEAIERGLPGSTRRIRSPDKIQYVLEINYTEVDRLEIGDRIALPPVAD